MKHYYFYCTKSTVATSRKVRKIQKKLHKSGENEGFQKKKVSKLSINLLLTRSLSYLKTAFC